jgi:hypothetical protein
MPGSGSLAPVGHRRLGRHLGTAARRLADPPQDIDGISRACDERRENRNAVLDVGEFGYHVKHVHGVLQKALRPRMLPGRLPRSLTRMHTPTSPMCMIWPLSLPDSTSQRTKPM